MPLSPGQVLRPDAQQNVWLVSSVRHRRSQVSAFTVVRGKYVLRADGALVNTDACIQSQSGQLWKKRQLE